VGNTNAIRFRLYSDTELARIREPLQKAFSAWAGEWLSPMAQGFELRVSSHSKEVPATAARWLVVSRGDTALAAIGALEDGVMETLVTGLAAKDTEGDTASRASRRLGEVLLQELAIGLMQAVDIKVDRGACAWSPAPPRNQELTRPGSGWAYLKCEWGVCGSLSVLLSPEVLAGTVDGATRHSGKNAKTVTPLRRAIEGRPVRVSVVLGEAELELCDLETLTAGDVIRLDRKISEPLSIRTESGDVVCGAQVGVLDGRRAIQLVMKR